MPPDPYTLEDCSSRSAGLSLSLPTHSPRRRLRDVWFCAGDVELEGGNVRSLPTIALLLQACVDVQMLGAFGNSSHSW